MNAKRSQGHAPCIAITGGVACGKSALGRIFAELGADVVDADEIAHELQRPGGPLAEKIKAVFGAAYLTNEGAVDRIRLSRLVFGNAAAMKRLNDASRELVRGRLLEWRDAPPGGRKLKVALVPLLFEASWEKDWDSVVCVACDRDAQVARLAKRGIGAEEAGKRIDAHLAQEVKIARADYVVYNNGSLEELAGKAAKIYNEIVEKA